MALLSHVVYAREYLFMQVYVQKNISSIAATTILILHHSFSKKNIKLRTIRCMRVRREQRFGSLSPSASSTSNRDCAPAANTTRSVSSFYRRKVHRSCTEILFLIQLGMGGPVGVVCRIFIPTATIWLLFDCSSFGAGHGSLSKYTKLTEGRRTCWAWTGQHE